VANLIAHPALLSRKPIGGSWRSLQQERSDLFDRFAKR
jgi:hypothetical protein